MKPEEVIQNVTKTIEENANVKAVFGEPVKEKTITIIPVAKTSVKGGGGGGMGQEKTRGKGGGMGLGLMVDTTPIGYIQIKDSKAEFVDIVDKSKMMTGALALGGFVFLLLAKSLSRK